MEMEKLRWTIGKMQNPVRGLLHGSAAVMSLVGLGFLVARANSSAAVVSAVMFSVGMVALFTTSSLYHSVNWRPKWKLRMQRLDHSMIFFLIATSYTPVALLVLDGFWTWLSLGVVWTLAVVGITDRLLGSMKSNWFAFTLMMVLGWLAAPFMGVIWSRAGLAAVVLFAAGGVLYSVGMVFNVTRWPRMWPRVFSAHELFHVMVVAASAFHWVATYRFLIPMN
jgi:hemolysin III